MRKKSLYLFYIFIYLLNYFWQHWVFVAVQGLFLVEASGSHSLVALHRLLMWWFLLLQSTGSRARGVSSCGSWILEHSSILGAHRLSCSTACGIFLEQGSNPCSLHWRVDSLPLDHQRSPKSLYINHYILSISCGWLSPYLSVSTLVFFAILSLPHPGPVRMEWDKNEDTLWMRYLLSESQYGKILFCIFHPHLYFGFLNLNPWLICLLILRRAKLASCCDAVQNFIVSQNNTPIGTNMTYEVESKSKIQIKEDIFDMLPVVSENFLWFLCVTI